MKQPRLSRLELRVMDVLWKQGVCSIREVEDGLPERGRPAYSTVQTLVYRLEAKKAVRRVKKIGSAYLFEASISRQAAQGRLIDEFLDMFGGLIQPVMVHLVETEKLRPADLAELEKLVHEAQKKETEVSALFDHLWQSTVFALGVYLLTLALRRNRAAVRYGLWFAASVKFLLPFSLLIALASEVILPLTAPLIVSPSAYVAQQAVQPFAVMAPQWIPPAAAKLDGTAMLAALWGFGLAAIVALWLIHSWRLRRTLRSAVDAPQAPPLPVKLSPSLQEPELVGLWRPVLLLPEGITALLSPAEMKAIMAHELSHLRRRDNFTAAIHMGVVALFWFYPVIWWIGARLIEERERACDEAVVASGNDPSDYASGIVKVCKFYLQSPLPCAAGISGADLRKRVQTIVAGCRTLQLDPARKLLLVGSAATVLAAPLLMGLSAAPMIPAKKSPVAQTVMPIYADQMRPREAVKISPAAMDKYMGYYQFSPISIVEISRDGSHFFTRAMQPEKLEIFPSRPGEFFNNRIHAQFTFETNYQDNVTSLLIHQNGAIFRSPRLDEVRGRELKVLLEQQIATRVKNKIANPGTEAALRRLVLSLEAGQPNYEEIGPVIGENLREELPFIQSRIKNWGGLKSITLKKVGPAGNGLFDVRFANGSVEWEIYFMDGKIRGMSKLADTPFRFSGGLFN